MRRHLFLLIPFVPFTLAGCEDGPAQTFSPATGTLFNNGDTPAYVGDAGASIGQTFTGTTAVQICDGKQLQQEWGAMDSQPIAPVQFIAGLDLDNGPSYPLLSVEQTELGPLFPVTSACVTEPSKTLFGASPGATPSPTDPCLSNVTQEDCQNAANAGKLCGWNVIPYVVNGKPADLTSNPPAPTKLCQAQNLGQGPDSDEVGGSLVAGFGNASEFQLEWALPTHKAYYILLSPGYVGHMTWNYLTPSDGQVHRYDVSIGKPVLKDGANYSIAWSNPKQSSLDADEIYRGVASTFAPDIYDDAAPGVTLTDTGTGFVDPGAVGGVQGEIGMRPVSFYIIFYPNNQGAAESVTVYQMYALNIKYAPYSGASSYFKMFDPNIDNAEPFATAQLGNAGPGGTPKSCTFGIGDTFENLLENCIDVFNTPSNLVGTVNDPNTIAENKVLGGLSHDDQNYTFNVVGIGQNFRPAKLDVCTPALKAAGINCGTDIEDVVHDTDSLLADAKNATANEFQSDVRSFGPIQNDAYPPGTPVAPATCATSADCASAAVAAVCDLSGDANNGKCVTAAWTHDFHGGGAVWREYGRLVQTGLNADYVALHGAAFKKHWHDASCMMPEACVGGAGSTPSTCTGTWGTGTTMEMAPLTPCNAGNAATVCTQPGATCNTAVCPGGGSSCFGLTTNTCVVPFSASGWRPAQGCTGFETMVTDAEPAPDGDTIATAADDLFDNLGVWGGVGAFKPGDPYAYFCDDPGSFNFCNTTVTAGTQDLLTVSQAQVLAFLGGGNPLDVPEEGRDRRYFFQQWSTAYAKYLISPHVLDTGLASKGAILNGVAVNGNQVGDFSRQFIDTDNFIFDSFGTGGARSEYVNFDAADVNNDPVDVEQKMLILSSNLQFTNFYRKLDREERALFNSLALDSTQASWGYLRRADGTFLQDTYLTGANAAHPGVGAPCTSNADCTGMNSTCDTSPKASDVNGGYCVNAFNRHNANPFITNLAGTQALAKGGWAAPKDTNKSLVPAPAGWADPCNPVSVPATTCAADSDCPGIQSCTAGACVAAKTQYFCATHVDADCAKAGNSPPLNDDGSILTRANGKPLLEGYCSIFGQPSPYALNDGSAIQVVKTFPDLGEAFVSLPTYDNPYAGKAPTGAVQVMVPWLPLQEGVGYPVANGATGGSQDVFVVTAQLDFTGQVITPVMDYLPVGAKDDPNPTNPATPFGVKIEAWETSDFLGEIFLCYDGTSANDRQGTGRPGDILSAHMYSSAAAILDWLSSHPLAQSACQIVVRYSPFNNFPDYVTSLANGVRVDIDQGYGYGRVVDATLFDPGMGSGVLP